MKLSNFLVGTLACTMFAACSNEENPAVNSGQEEGQLSYVAVNIINANSAGSRVDREQDYEDGKGNENTITKARFYLFDASDAPYTVTTNGAAGAVSETNYVDITSLENQGKDAPNVEAITNGVLVFKGTTSELPTSIVAVLNPPESLTGKKSLSDLQKAIADYGLTTSFVMSNSVYAKEDTKAKVVATDIVGKVAQNKEDAEANPVDIYVERVLAKVEVTFSNADKEASGDDGPQYIVSGTDASAVYAKVLGWAITTDNRTSNLLKDINVNWNNTNLGFTWNDEPYHRSYWAITPESITPVNDKSADDIIGETGEARYCQENTSSTHTNVIVVAKLVNNSDVAQPIYKYYGMNYTSENDILTLIANKYAKTYYTKTTSEKYTSIAPTDMEFKASTVSGVQDYEVVAQLKNNVTIYIPKDGEEYEAVDATTVNAELAKNPAQIAKNGYVYYYTPIKHLASEAGKTGEYGVVRNHVYKVTITDITGFGTPIYNPDKPIIPTKPQDRETYIAARINILSWRIVNNNNVILGQ